MKILIGIQADGFSLQIEGNDSTYKTIDQEDNIAKEVANWITGYLGIRTELVEEY